MASNTAELVASKPATLPGPVETLNHDGLWIGSRELASIAHIIDRNAREALFRALNNHAWRGASLEVRAIEGAGGRAGKALQVYVPSLPAALRAIWHKRNPGALKAPAIAPIEAAAPTAIDVGIGGRVAEMKWKLAIVAPALMHPRGTRARAAVLADIASREHPGLNGTPVQIAVDTMRDWLAKVEGGNEKALARPRRADAGKRRYFVNAKWDKTCPLPDTAKRPIADAIEGFIRGLWREATNSEGKVNALASAELQGLSRAAGWHDAPLIRPGLHLVRRLSPSRLVGIKEKDAKRFHDQYTPRIHRRRPDYPMDIVIGDVHPVDVLLTREDGTEGTARMIAWLDLANNDLFYTLVLLQKGKGITQAHIAASFVDMVQAWGLPRTLYLDNGSEYQWAEMIAGFEKLQGLCEGFRVFIAGTEDIDAAAGIEGDSAATEQAPRATVRAKPYNAQAKAIEGVFSALEKFIALIPGYIGGNRMKKKTHNVGKKPAPFPGSFEDFEQGAFAEAVAFYRNEPQRGTMGGKSPNERKRAAIAAGWKPGASVPRESFLFAFAKPYQVRVHPGGIQIEAEWFNCDELIPEMGSKIDVWYAKWDGSFALWITPDGTAVLIQRETDYHPLDIAGAKEQSRRAGIQTANVRRLAAISPHVDTVAAMARYNAALPLPPETPAGPEIKLEPEARALMDAIQEGADTVTAPPGKLPHLTYREDKTGEVVHPARIAPAPDAERFDIWDTPPPQKTKTDASADAPVFDFLAELVKNPPLNDQAKETESK